MTKDIKEYIWNSLDELSHIFPKTVIQKLNSLISDKNKKDFFEQLEIVFDIDPSLLKQTQEIYSSYLMDSEENLPVFIKLLDESFIIDFREKIKIAEKAEQFIQKSTIETLELATLYENLSYVYSEMEEHEKAEKFCNIALTIRLNNVDKNHPDIAKNYQSFGYMYTNAKNVIKAEEYYTKALEIQHEILGDKHPDTAKSYQGIGHINNLFFNRYKTAKEYYTKALEIQLETLGEKHPYTAKSYQGLGVTYFYLDDNIKADENANKALMLRLELFGENHPETANSYHLLGYLYSSLNEYSKSKEYFEKALNIRLKIFGENDINIGDIYIGLGEVSYKLAEYHKAEMFYTKALDIQLKIYGENHEETANSYYNLGNVFFSLKNNLKAKVYYEKSLKAYLSIVKNTHANTADIYNNLGVCFDRLDSIEKAKEHFIKAFNTAIKCLDISHPDTKLYYSNIILSTNKLNESFFTNTNNSSIESIIKNINITNFKLLADINIDFSPNINIIIGQNSSGKTSLLQAITLTLLQENYRGESNDKYESFISKGQNEANVKLITTQEYTKNVVIKKNKREIDNKVLSPFVLAYCSNIFTKDAIEVNDFVNEILEGKIRKSFTDSIFEDYTDQYYNPKSILNKLAQTNTKLAQDFEAIIADTINDFLDDFNLVKDTERRYYFKHKNEKNYRLQELSEGYRNTIVLIGDIVVKILGTGQRPRTVEGIILIDEFDRHLHPKIQTNLVSKLLKHFPKIQFILTTHNPMAILDRKQDEIIILHDRSGNIQSQKGIGTETIDVGTVLLKYFAVESLVGNTMQKNIERSVELQLQDELTNEEENELTQLKDELSNTVATNFIYNKAYYNFLKFLKKYPALEYQEFKELNDEDMYRLMEKWKKVND